MTTHDSPDPEEGAAGSQGENPQSDCSDLPVLSDITIEELEQRLEMQVLMDADIGASYGPQPAPPPPPNNTVSGPIKVY
jgi:hypothetical protein